MKPVSWKKKIQLAKEYKGKPKIKVTDFQSAIRACEQQCAKNFRKECNARISEKYEIGRYFTIEQNASDHKLRYNYDYIGKIMRGEIKPKCRKNTLRFYAIIKNKYGSVKRWRMLKAVRDD